jgi:tetratricopeptide (TPR) repeat protein
VAATTRGRPSCTARWSRRSRSPANRAFLGAALGASERYDESVRASTTAIEQDPQYGLAYYNRALVLQRMGKKGRAVKDLKRAQEVDLPRRFRTAVQKMLEELS